MPSNPLAHLPLATILGRRPGGGASASVPSDSLTKSYTTTDDEYGDLISEHDFDDEGFGAGEFYHQFDAQANANAMLDDTGSVVQTFRYQAFGLPAQSPGLGFDGWANLSASDWSGLTASGWASLPVNPGFVPGGFRNTYGGQKAYYLDPELQLYMLGMGATDGGGRYYDPPTAKFLSDDPLRQSAGDLNLSRYVENNPVQKIDPGGKQALMDPLAEILSPPPQPIPYMEAVATYQSLIAQGPAIREEIADLQAKIADLTSGKTPLLNYSFRRLGPSNAPGGRGPGAPLPFHQDERITFRLGLGGRPPPTLTVGEYVEQLQAKIQEDYESLDKLPADFAALGARMRASEQRVAEIDKQSPRLLDQIERAEREMYWARQQAFAYYPSRTSDDWRARAALFQKQAEDLRRQDALLWAERKALQVPPAPSVPTDPTSQAYAQVAEIDRALAGYHARLEEMDASWSDWFWSGFGMFPGKAKIDEGRKIWDSINAKEAERAKLIHEHHLTFFGPRALTEEDVRNIDKDMAELRAKHGPFGSMSKEEKEQYRWLEQQRVQISIEVNPITWRDLAGAVWDLAGAYYVGKVAAEDNAAKSAEALMEARKAWDRALLNGKPPPVLRVSSANPTEATEKIGVRSANPSLVEQPRNALGQFAPKMGGEVAPGSIAEGAVWDAIEAKPGWQVVRGRVYATDATGQVRVYDGYAMSPNGRVIGLEVKSGTASLTGKQRAFDLRLNSNYQNKAFGIGQYDGLQIDRALEIRWP